jgi:hypothetical protein
LKGILGEDDEFHQRERIDTEIFAEAHFIGRDLKFGSQGPVDKTLNNTKNDRGE